MKGEPLPIIACSLGSEELDERKGEFRSLFDEALIEARRIDGGIRLQFGTGVGARVQELVRKESECCPFFGFEISDDSAGTTLVVTAPPDALPLLDEMLAGRPS